MACAHAKFTAGTQLVSSCLGLGLVLGCFSGSCAAAMPVASAAATATASGMVWLARRWRGGKPPQHVTPRWGRWIHRESRRPARRRRSSSARSSARCTRLPSLP